MCTLCTESFSSTRAGGTFVNHFICKAAISQCSVLLNSFQHAAGENEGLWSPGSEEPHQINLKSCYPEIFIQEKERI